MNRRFKRFIMFLLAIVTIISGLGCADSTQDNRNYSQMLKQDAFAGLKSVYQEDFTRLTIIRGALYKFIIDNQNLENLGVVIGAVQATAFPQEYEIKRLQDLTNISADMRKQIISQPMLAITMQNREALNHIYTAVLKPLSEKLHSGSSIKEEDKVVLNDLIKTLDSLTQDYLTISNSDINFNSKEAQDSFMSIRNNFEELQKYEMLN